MQRNTEMNVCDFIGHLWRSTTSEKAQVCSREGCSAVRRFYRDVWIIQKRTSTPRKRQPVARQAGLFSPGE